MVNAPNEVDKTTTQSFSEKLEAKVDEINRSSVMQQIAGNSDKIIRMINK